MLKLILFFILLQNQPNEKTPETKTPEIKTPEINKTAPVQTKIAEKERLILIESFPSFNELRVNCKKASSQIYNTVECKSIRALEDKYSDCLRNDIKGCQFIKTTYNVFNYFDYYQKCKEDPGFRSDCKNISEDK
ncbi:hypothetical protein KKD49_01745, partial [Myxococcota bacterium]|nr:hypothetical protein [Myxococcota bacterium]